MMNKYTLLICLPFLVALFSCNKKCKEGLQTPIITYDNPISEGDNFVLVARGEEDDSYSWKGPNNFTASTKEVNLGYANVMKSGLYEVSISRKDCGTKSSSANIQVVVAEPPCTPAINIMEIDKYPNIEDQSPSCGYDEFRDKFTINLSSLYGSVYIIFPNKTAPEFNSNYVVVREDSTLEFNEVVVEVYSGDPSNLRKYFGANGFVFVRLVDNFIDITICDLLLASDDDTAVLTGRVSCEL